MTIWGDCTLIAGLMIAVIGGAVLLGIWIDRWLYDLSLGSESPELQTRLRNRTNRTQRAARRLFTRFRGRKPPI